MFNKKEKEMTAILIEKKVTKSSNSGNEVSQLYKMKYGTYNSEVEGKKKSKQEYYVIFMTKKGQKQLLVSPEVYHRLKINALGILVITGNKFTRFKLDKIASKKDVEKLGW